MIERLPTRHGRVDVDAEALLHALLPDEFGQPLRAERELDGGLFGEDFRGGDLGARHCYTLPAVRETRNVVCTEYKPNTGGRGSRRTHAERNSRRSLSSESYTASLRLYRGHHERHVRDLTQLIESRGGTPIQLPHLRSGLFKLAMQQAARLGGDQQVLLAFRTNERQVRDKYRRLANESGHPENVALVLERNARDEETHYAWVQRVLDELGVTRTAMGRMATAMEEPQARAMSVVERAERGAIRAAQEVGRAVEKSPLKAAALAIGATLVAAGLSRR